MSAPTPTPTSDVSKPAAPKPSPVTEITSITQFKELTNDHVPVIIEFHAPWCAPCKAMSPIFRKMSEKPEFQAIRFAKLDTDAHEDISTAYGVRAMPTFTVFRNGGEVEKVLGARPGLLEELVKKAVNLVTPAPSAPEPTAPAQPTPTPSTKEGESSLAPPPSL